MIPEDIIFIKELQEVFETEEYDNLIDRYGDEWNIIERLLKVIEDGGLLNE